MNAIRQHGRWLLCALGVVGTVIALGLNAPDTRAAAGQDWPPFVLVSGLLLVGLVSEEDGLFRAAGQLLARRARNGALLYAGAVLLIAVVTALLNLDTSVAFLTPVFVYTARSRGEGEAPLLYACILLSNAGSLILPGSNLTNLIVLGHVHLSGGDFFRRMAPAGVASVLVTALVIAVCHHRELRADAAPAERFERPRLGVGMAAVLAATVLVVALPDAALPVAAVGVIAVALRLRPWRAALGRAGGVLGVPILIGLFGIAVALGTLGRAWSGPSELLTQLGPWATAGVAAGSTVVVNNLPAASLLSARSLSHPFSLLVGLNVGPNLFISGSLAWVLWWRSARTTDARPSLLAAGRLGLISAPLAIAAAMAVLTASGTH
ncbi:MAG TPA: SLC13 family permease [Solirubrobacteraceae bacterium]|nr:SLC13 family permease [Solirubrobacteraceae bacterium]